MKLAIMQPYFFPYLGYFQLINAVDTFVIYDDVNYIKQGWINRNRIICNNNEFYFTLQIKNASSFKRINELAVGCNHRKLLQNISHSYSKAPFFKVVFPVLMEILQFGETNLVHFIVNGIQRIGNFLDINTKFIISSRIEKDNSLKGQTKVLHICELLNAGCYINSIGGRDLYSKEEFAKHNIELFFLHSDPLIYNNSKTPFLPNLSIIDVLMYNSKSRIIDELNKVALI